MFNNVITPRFLETDALGHINNTVLPTWFEAARDPIFRFFTPDMDVKNWKLMLATFTVNFHAETHYGVDVEIKTYISRIGNSSFDVYQECWQSGHKTASGTTTMVHYCHKEKSSQPLTESILEQMKQHLLQS
ncbi:thioesterase family protein [Psychrobium sp. 1_MG-2023]|uniref:acyl-CoA thioesterase n=1 Tax=Psychrobium sp. 1_MG-2023 TaxID=3062624 RepID=UPI000C349106|nr:thioesterase family protein [Psychrobium sp. 1_MG-2023]MDP2561070.1 thioesterase family protein [Psychrobium sp. 1_MG-2023]PKF58360.1 thioesterase [Alteromonadales bacterium alter-6D02]